MMGESRLSELSGVLNVFKMEAYILNSRPKQYLHDERTDANLMRNVLCFIEAIVFQKQLFGKRICIKI